MSTLKEKTLEIGQILDPCFKENSNCMKLFDNVYYHQISLNKIIFQSHIEKCRKLLTKCILENEHKFKK